MAMNRSNSACSEDLLIDQSLDGGRQNTDRFAPLPPRLVWMHAEHTVTSIDVATARSSSVRWFHLMRSSHEVEFLIIISTTL